MKSANHASRALCTLLSLLILQTSIPPTFSQRLGLTLEVCTEASDCTSGLHCGELLGTGLTTSINPCGTSSAACFCTPLSIFSFFLCRSSATCRPGERCARMDGVPSALCVSCLSPVPSLSFVDNGDTCGQATHIPTPSSGENNFEGVPDSPYISAEPLEDGSGPLSSPVGPDAPVPTAPTVPDASRAPTEPSQAGVSASPVPSSIEADVSPTPQATSSPKVDYNENGSASPSTIPAVESTPSKNTAPTTSTGPLVSDPPATSNEASTSAQPSALVAGPSSSASSPAAQPSPEISKIPNEASGTPLLIGPVESAPSRPLETPAAPQISKSASNPTGPTASTQAPQVPAAESTAPTIPGNSPGAPSGAPVPPSKSPTIPKPTPVSTGDNLPASSPTAASPSPRLPDFGPVQSPVSSGIAAPPAVSSGPDATSNTDIVLPPAQTVPSTTGDSNPTDTDTPVLTPKPPPTEPGPPEESGLPRESGNPVSVSTPTASPSPSWTPEKRTPEPEQTVGDGETVTSSVCIATSSLQGFARSDLIFPEHREASVLCDTNGSCATAGHMVVFRHRAMSMATYCGRADVVCEKRVTQVNSPRFVRALRVPSRTEGLEFTALAARFETWVEERFLQSIVHAGL